MPYREASITVHKYQTIVHMQKKLSVAVGVPGVLQWLSFNTPSVFITIETHREMVYSINETMVPTAM